MADPYAEQDHPNDFFGDDTTNDHDNHHDYYYSSHSMSSRIYARYQAARQQGLLPFSVLRAGGAPPPELYYGVLSVAVETLALLLFVEACRRKLDHYAAVNRRPIFQAVLDGVYRELATLGIVELFIHLLHEYYDNLDTQKESIFVDVHFVFFYCAIFNALQSSLLAFFAHRVSYHTWVRTEELEINHYVEIREEFDQVRQELYGDDAPYLYTAISARSRNGNNDNNETNDHQEQQPQERPTLMDSMKNLSERLSSTRTASLYAPTDAAADTSSSGCWESLQRLGFNLFYTFKYPQLKAKHDKLLVQVRFHELRVHFLQAYDLPNKMKISTYLMRSEQDVIKHLIHVSTMAWLWLTGLITFMYYVTGIITDITQDAGSAGVTLPVFFFLGMTLFIVVSLLVHSRMHYIFMRIMEMKHLWDFSKEDPIVSSQRAGDAMNDNDEDDDHNDNQYTDPTLASEQKQLFFLGDPKLVIIAIQFMQFGYAIALSVVVVYWEDMSKASSGVSAEGYLLTTLICYCVFVVIMAQTLVRFTMATSLGQLVDRKRLHETVAIFRLEEAERRRQQRKDLDMNFYFSGQQQPLGPWKHRNTKAGSLPHLHAEEVPVRPQSHAPQAPSNPEAAPLARNTAVEVVLNNDSKPGVQEPSPSVSRVAPTGNPTNSTALRGEPPMLPVVVPPVFDTPPRAGAPPPAAAVAVPEKKQQQATIPTLEKEKANLLVDLVKMDTQSLRNVVPLEQRQDIQRAERRDRRRNRRKSVSDGVALMAGLGTSVPSFFGGSNTSNNISSNSIGESSAGASASKKPATTPGQETTTTTPKFAVDDSALVKRKERRRNWKKSVSASAAIQQMRDFEDPNQPAADASTRTDPSDVWANKIITTKPPPSTGIMSKLAPMNMFAPNNNNTNSNSNLTTATKDDSTTAVIAAQQRRDRRQRSRKKALSASAAIRLMREGSDDDDEQQRERQAMMDFWKAPPTKHETVPEDAPLEPTTTTTPNAAAANDASKDQQSSTEEQQELQNQAFLAAVNNDNGPAIPKPRRLLPTVREVSGDVSGHLEEFSDRDLFASPAASSNGDTLGKSDTNFEDDDDTVETDRSVGGLSHVGDVSEGDINQQQGLFFDDEDDYHDWSFSERLSRWNDGVRKFFLSRRYGFVTHLLGSMGCFFIIGMRIEGFLKENCVIPVEDFSWEFPLKAAFWLITTFLILFLVMGVWNIVLFPAYRDDVYVSGCSKRVQWIRFIAALIDIVISFTCLMLFWGAEIARCCDGDEYPSSGAAYYPDNYGYEGQKDKYGDGTSGSYESESSTKYGNPDDVDHRVLAGGYDTYDKPKPICVDSTTYCNCPAFGTRKEGGLGGIEPFVALIVLRMFRYMLASRIVRRFDLGRVVSDLVPEEAKSRRSQHGGLISEHAGHGGVDKLKQGTVVELWQAAIAQFPEIVEEHGEFSGELLQAMLGVEVIGPPKLMQPPPDQVQEAASMPSSPKPSEAALSALSGKGILSRKNSLPSSDHLPVADHFTLQEKKYTKLAPEVQCVIAAGKLGCPVKSCGDLAAMGSRPPSAANLSELGDPSVGTSTGIGVEFERDVAQLELEQMESAFEFDYPNERLVRSMRLCDKKLLPFCDKWCPVDVVLTKHEIVYVHAMECSNVDKETNHTIETGRQALIATKGGKKLRLIDVTAGRKVIGHVKMEDITSVHVERRIRREGTTPGSAEELNHGHVEFWQNRLEKDREECAVDRQKRWEAIHEDSLKIETISGTLYLRFYSDLEDSEAHPQRIIDELDENNPVYKDIALQWAQTIVRQCCHVTQLKQPLPHFGTDDQAEIKDLLQIVARDEKIGHRRRFTATSITGRGHRRFRSSGGRPRRPVSELPAMSQDDLENGTGTPNAEHPLKKGDASSPTAPQIPKPRKFTRFASYDDIEGQGQPKQREDDDDEGRARSVA